MKHKGVTLLEMLAAVAIFAIIVGAISGIFISAIRTQRRILANQELLDQTSYVLEYIGRALRMARKDTTGSCIFLGSNYAAALGIIQFIDYNGVCTTYILQVGRINKITPYDPDCPAATPCSLTSDKLQVNSLKFNLSGESETDNLQPRVTIFLEILGRDIGGNRPKVQIQTSISQRPLDVSQ